MNILRDRARELLPVLFLGAFVFSMHPNGVVMRFGGPDGVSHYEYVAHYSMLPFGYGKWGPMITFLSTAVGTVLSVVLAISKKEKLLAAVRACGVVTIVSSVITLMLSGTMTMFGFVILFAAAAVVVVSCAAMKE